MSNLPPGCSINDIPGNRPEDMEWEAVWDAVDDMGLYPDEILAACRMWKEHVRPVIDDRVQDARSDAAEYEAYLKDELYKRGWEND